jgi:hypothetical protein
VLRAITTVLPSVAVPEVGSLPVDKLGSELEEAVLVGAVAKVELAPATMLLASAGEIVVVVGPVSLDEELLERTSDMMVSAPWSIKARVGPITISPANWTNSLFANG